MKVGLPSAGEQLSYSSSQVVITYFINMLGVEALATRTYCVNIIMFAYLFSISMAQGGAICIGHLIGEKKPHAAFLWEIRHEEIRHDYRHAVLHPRSSGMPSLAGSRPTPTSYVWVPPSLS